jgi:hypothetical protein
MSKSEPPHSPSPHHGPLKSAPRGALSKIAGAGAGTGLVVWAEKFGLGPNWTIIIQAAAPWIAVGFSVGGPYAIRIAMQKVRHMWLRRLLKNAKKFLAEVTPNTPAYETAKDNVHTLEQMIADLLKDDAAIIPMRS